jgi:hypothetical protein
MASMRVAGSISQCRPLGMRSPRGWRSEASPLSPKEAGAGPRFVRVGRRVRYRTADVDAWLELHSRQSISDPGTRASDDQR